MADIKIPGIGPVDKKWVYGGAALIAGIVGYAYWSRAQSSDDTTITDYTTDPGYDYAYDGAVPEYVNPGGSTEPVEEDYLAEPTTNAEWTQTVIAALSEIGYEGLFVSATIGKYLGRQDLTRTEADLIRSAIATVGPPPDGEFPITVAKESSPEDTGPDADDFPDMTAPTGLSAYYIDSTVASFRWNAVSGARYYSVHVPGRGTLNTASTYLNITNLKPNTRYRAKVRAYDMDKKPGPWSGYRTFRTKR